MSKKYFFFFWRKNQMKSQYDYVWESINIKTCMIMWRIRNNNKKNEKIIKLKTNKIQRTENTNCIKWFWCKKHFANRKRKQYTFEIIFNLHFEMDKVQDIDSIEIKQVNCIFKNRLKHAVHENLHIKLELSSVTRKHLIYFWENFFFSQIFLCISFSPIYITIWNGQFVGFY